MTIYHLPYHHYTLICTIGMVHWQVFICCYRARIYVYVPMHGVLWSVHALVFCT